MNIKNHKISDLNPSEYNPRRRARVIELDPGYCATILERYENLTGIKGMKIL